MQILLDSQDWQPVTLHVIQASPKLEMTNPSLQVEQKPAMLQLAQLVIKQKAVQVFDFKTYPGRQVLHVVPAHPMQPAIPQLFVQILVAGLNVCPPVMQVQVDPVASELVPAGQLQNEGFIKTKGALHVMQLSV